MINEQDKQRIEQAALIEYPDRANNGIRFREYNAKERFAYMLGRTAELERSEKLPQEYREVNKELVNAVEDALKYHWLSYESEGKLRALIKKSSLLHQPKEQI